MRNVLGSGVIDRNEIMARQTSDGISATAVRECRLRFLRTAGEHPRIRLWQSLKQEVFDPCFKSWADLGLPVPMQPYEEWTSAQRDAMPTFREEAQRRIESWAASQNLNYDWVRSEVQDALRLDSTPEQHFAALLGYSPLQFWDMGWYPDYESKAKYRDRMMVRIQSELHAYTDAAERGRRQFLNHRQSEAVHYRWAVEHVCLRWGWSRIARESAVEVNYQAVTKAVRIILERIGIPLRPQPKRPPKSSS